MADDMAALVKEYKELHRREFGIEPVVAFIEGDEARIGIPIGGFIGTYDANGVKWLIRQLRETMEDLRSFINEEAPDAK